MAVVYYFTFRLIIRKFNYPTPGRDVGDTTGTAGKVSATGTGAAAEVQLAERVLTALGGSTNVVDAVACMSRLRVRLLNPHAVDEAKIAALPSSGVTRTDAYNWQLVLGPNSEQIREKMSDIIGQAQLVTLLSPLDGEVIPLSAIPDAAFAQGMLGPGVGIVPQGNLLVAPVSGRIAKLFPGGHAVVIKTEGGLEVLLHVGIDTVELKGQGFEVLCAEGETATAGQALVRFDREVIAKAGKSVHSVMTVMNKELIELHQAAQDGKVVRGKSAVFCLTPAKLESTHRK